MDGGQDGIRMAFEAITITQKQTSARSLSNGLETG